MYTYMYIFMFIHTHMCVCVCVCACVRACVRVCVRAWRSARGPAQCLRAPDRWRWAARGWRTLNRGAM